MSIEKEFTKENLNLYLKELAKEFRKRNGKTMGAEIILVGGAAILSRYGFRDVTQDIDAIIMASSAMKEAINVVGDKYGLPTGWVNSDFMQTESYSPKLVNMSKHYRTFSNIVDIRIVDSEYLIAMKLKSGRIYKKDLSDVIGIIKEHLVEHNPMTIEKIDAAVTTLYGSWEEIKPYARKLLSRALSFDDPAELEEYFNELQAEEKLNKAAAINAEKYGEKLTGDSIDEVIRKARSRQTQTKPSVTKTELEI